MLPLPPDPNQETKDQPILKRIIDYDGIPVIEAYPPNETIVFNDIRRFSGETKENKSEEDVVKVIVESRKPDDIWDLLNMMRRLKRMFLSKVHDATPGKSWVLIKNLSF